MAALLPLVLFLAVAIWVGHVVHCRRLTALTEATVSLLVGILAGGCVAAWYVWTHGGGVVPESLLEFNTEVCFTVLLPPIIFNAGFTVKRRAFFKNFMTLALFGVVGTFLTAAIIAAGALPLSLLQLLQLPSFPPTPRPSLTTPHRAASPARRHLPPGARSGRRPLASPVRQVRCAALH